MSGTNDVAIKVDRVSKSFKLPHERHSSIKSLLLGFYKKNKSYEKQQVLKNVSFEIKKGEFFAIVGRNGSGKSTLLKLLAGIYSPNKGVIQVNGQLTPFIELGVGFNPELSGRENVYLSGALLGFNRKDMLAMYDDIVEFAELERFMDQKLKNYSSGMQVRLAFSIAIRAKTDILLLDEVLAVGDAAFQQKCYDYFEELKREQKTVVFVSHDMGAVNRFCTKAIYVENGKLLREGSPSEITDLYMEKNIEELPDVQESETDEGPKLSKAHKISSKITNQTKEAVAMAISYTTPTDDPTYVGMSLVRDGVSVAEMTTSLERPLTGNGGVEFTIDTGILNPGMYDLHVALFRLQNRQLLAIGKHKNKFVLKGNDITRAAAIKLADTWKYE